jgi:hypothetical protein
MFTRCLVAAALISLSVQPLAADMKSKTRMTMGPGQGSAPSFESASYIKGARQRQEMQMFAGLSTVSITQCDLKRIVTLNERNKTYMITPLGDESDAGTPAASEPEKTSPSKSTKKTDKAEQSKPGGVITITTNITDTGETKQMFGYKARRIKMQMTSDASPGSQCGANMNIQTDGWYIDFAEQQFSCSTSPRAIALLRSNGGGGPSCADKIRFKSTGSARLGYPVYQEMTMSGQQGQPVTMKQETLDLSKAQLDQALFEIPPGYREVKDYRELMGGFTGMIGAGIAAAKDAARSGALAGPVSEQTSASAKEAGKLRVGVVRFSNSANAALPDSKYRDVLVNEFRDINVDAVALPVDAKASKDQVEAACKAVECDYVVYTDLSQSKDSSGAKKAGGFLSKMTGVDTGGATAGGYQLGFKYRLFGSSDMNTPKLESTESASESNADASASAALERQAMMVAVQIKRDQEMKRRAAKQQ